MGFREGLNPSYAAELLNGFDQSARRANHFVFSEMACPAPFAKIFPFRPDPNQMHIQTVPSLRGAARDRHGRGAGCGGRGSVRRCQGMAGRVDKARELTNGMQTDDAFRVRQSRVVLAPVAGVKSAEVSRPDRA